MCGIAGIVTKTRQPFDFSTFCVLGIDNDSRGGDSCGVFIDGKYEYGVNNNKLFSNYFQDSDLIYNTTSSIVALLHCRKASVGSISEETAQPVIIKDELGNVRFVVIHNGTIHNYKELANKYIPNVDITGMTDSQVMTHIFYNAGYNVLGEYIGGAAFCIVDYRGYLPRTLLFKGASKKYTYSKEIDEERPLFYCIDPIRRELVFSSLWLPLMAMRKNCKLYTPRSNTLVEFSGTTMRVVKEYSRENCCQHEKTKYNYSYTPSQYIDIDDDRNNYVIKGELIHGEKCISKWGRVLDSNSTEKLYKVYFFNGVLLKGEKCFKFLSNMQRKSKLSLKDFCSKYWNVIRFLSYDRIYNNGHYYYEATSPTSSKLFSGEIRPITTTRVIKVEGGIKRSTSYQYGRRDSLDTLLDIEDNINFKEILRECKLLRK